MLLIARRTVSRRRCCWLCPHGLAFRVAVAAWTAGYHVEKPVVGDGNGDPAVGNYHSCRAFAAGSSGVCAFGCARR